MIRETLPRPIDMPIGSEDDRVIASIGTIPMPSMLEIERQEPIPVSPPRPLEPPIGSMDASRQYNRFGPDEWERVYKEYVKTGSVKKIAEITGMSRREVNFLICNGLKRIGLPPIRDVTTDYGAVNVKAMQEVHRSAMITKPAVNQAVTERATREACQAQASLAATMKVTDVFLGYVEAVMARLVSNQGEYLIPDKLTVGYIKTLADISAVLAKASDHNVSLSRRTAGEPDRTIEHKIIGIVGSLGEAELREFLSTGIIPRRFATGGLDKNHEIISLPPSAVREMPEGPEGPVDVNDVDAFSGILKDENS